MRVRAGSGAVCSLPLPAHPWECHTTKSVASGKQPYIRFDGNDYSIPHHLVGKPLVLVATEEEVRITNGLHVFACDLLLKATRGVTIAVVSSRERKRRQPGLATDDPAFVGWHQLVRGIQGS